MALAGDPGSNRWHPGRSRPLGILSASSDSFFDIIRILATIGASIWVVLVSIAMVLRQIPVEMLSFEELGTPDVLVDLITRPRGLILVTGPTGSGKTTTLASAIDYLNQNIDHHIITIEDPVEFDHTHKKSIVNQREIGVDLPSFSEGIRRALRQDPDAILVGEMRDLETIEAAITAAETGHIVFGTLHTTGAAGTINRIIDVFPTQQQAQIRTQLSVAVIGILSQALLPKIGGGRVAAYEMLVCTPAVGNLIREDKTFRITSVIQTGQRAGMKLLDDDLFRLWKEGKCEKKEVLLKANSREFLADKIVREEQSMFEEEEEARGRLDKAQRQPADASPARGREK